MRLGIRRPELLTSLVLMDTSPDGEPQEALGRYKLLIMVIRLLGWWLVIIPNAGHICTIEEPRAVTRAIEDFLASL